MEMRIKKWGNSLALRIPKPLAIEAGIDENVLVELSLEEGKLMISPIPEPGVTLNQLLAQVTEDNLHDEIDTGPVVGSEIW